MISPLLANLFLHYALDLWIQRTYPHVPFARYADDCVIHCRSEAQAQKIMREIGQRLSQCGLALHPEKTKIVYCKDKSRKRYYPQVQFDFLGYRFQPRQIKTRYGTFSLSFTPAISDKAAKSIRHTIRQWKTHRWTQLSIEELADSFNPVLRGWINYYGQFYRSKLSPVLGQLDYALVRWATRKFKRVRSHKKARAWLRRIIQQQPCLFAHWQITFATMAKR